jgi:Ca-activated chloride channel family protein
MLAIAAAAAAQQSQPEQLPKYNVQVNLVSLDVEVLDSFGNPVLGLGRNDFLVKENGRAMEISNFAWMADRPVSLAAVLDTSAVSVEKLVTLKRFLRELAITLPRSDMLCLYSFDSRDAYLEMDFTSDRGRLWDALDNIAVPSGRSDGVLQELLGGDPRIGLAIDMAAHRLEKTDHGKKALLLISNRFRGLGPATVDHIQESGCTFLTLGSNSKAAILATLGGDWISKNQLLKQSGGRQFSTDTSDMTGVCRAIAYSLKNYYAVGYLTEIHPDEKRPRRVEVRVPGHHYTIHYRRSVSLVARPG